jgi:hypothetical protein
VITQLIHTAKVVITILALSRIVNAKNRAINTPLLEPKVLNEAIQTSPVTNYPSKTSFSRLPQSQYHSTHSFQQPLNIAVGKYVCHYGNLISNLKSIWEIV